MASKEDIISLPTASLRQRSRRVGLIDANIKQLIADMKAATIDWEASREHEVGVALAAVQIDKLYRVVIIRDNCDDKKDLGFTVLINPEITKYEGQVVKDYEGCLSVKNLYGFVPRYDKVRVKALDENGHEFRINAEGFMARILQHEIDHTNGIVYIDHIKDDKEAFFHLEESGKLEPADYEQVSQDSLLWE